MILLDGITVYNPSSDLFEVYLFSGDGIFSSILNLATFHLLAGSPFIFISFLGLIFWFQEGRVPISFYFGFTYLVLSTYVISDHIYIPYLITFGILLFIQNPLLLLDLLGVIYQADYQLIDPFLKWMQL